MSDGFVDDGSSRKVPTLIDVVGSTKESDMMSEERNRRAASVQSSLGGKSSRVE